MPCAQLQKMLSLLKMANLAKKCTKKTTEKKLQAYEAIEPFVE